MIYNYTDGVHIPLLWTNKPPGINCLKAIDMNLMMPLFYVHISPFSELQFALLGAFMRTTCLLAIEELPQGPRYLNECPLATNV